MRRPLLCLALALPSLLTAPLLAQEPERDAVPPPNTLTRTDAELPVDRIADLLALLPGVSSLNHGELSVRGAGATGNATYLDGIPITPGHRNLSGPLLGGNGWVQPASASASVPTHSKR